MRIEVLEPEAVRADWGRIGVLLAPAIRQHPGATISGVLKAILDGELLCLKVSDGADGIVCLSRCDGETGTALFVNYVAGSIEGGPKARYRAIKQFAEAIEAEARRLGCTEVQGGGRAWKALGWDVSDREGGGYSLRKVLT